MRTRICLTFVAVVLTAMSTGMLRAEFNPLDAVSSFGNRSFSAAVGASVRETSFTFTNVPNIDAYAATTYSPYFFGTRTIGENGFYTFCADLNYQPIGSGTASLSYNPLNGQTVNQTGKAMNIGTAWLYSQYATGVLQDFPYDVQTGTFPRFGGGDIEPGATMVYDAIALLMYGTTTAADVISLAQRNTFLQLMLNVNSDANYWLRTYDMRERNEYIGDYAVFVMRVNQGQDHLYVARADYGGGGTGEVPEPAMLLFWTLGGMGLAGTSWVRKRRMNQLARS